LKARVRRAREIIPLASERLRVVAVADTHGNPHPALWSRLEELHPDRLLHAGDVGDPAVLRSLEGYAPLTAVRGNIDDHALPDEVILDFTKDSGERGAELLLRILLTHIAVAGVTLRADVGRRARAEDVGLVVCGHSHVPFAAHDRGIAVFNPGSVGPRRFHLPIVLGVIEISTAGVSLRHIECATGNEWRPTG
jgi:putative phosphoesterase